MHPEIEFQENKELLLQPLYIARNEKEHVLIESSVNSTRVSINLRKQQEIEFMLLGMMERFLSLRASQFEVLRRKPIKGYDFSFLITSDHLEFMKKDTIVNFITEFIEVISKEITDMKLSINQQCRVAANYFTNSLANN